MNKVRAFFEGAAIVAIALLGSWTSGAANTGGPQEHVKVHGDWMIEVRSPNGTLVTRREFKNALTSQGGSLLTEMLGRRTTPGTWRVSLIGQTAAPCRTAGLLLPISDAPCLIVESTDTASGPDVFKNLNVGTSGFNNVFLSGSLTTLSDGDFGAVSTFVGECAGGVAPAACTSPATTSLLTSALVTPAIPVQAGQIVTVTVAIYFS